MQYMVRVEIHHKDRETYDLLHSAMEAESFSRTLTDEKTLEKVHMPTGAYWTEALADRWAVLESAKRAALPIDPTAEIVVSGDGRIVFFNCPNVLPEPFVSFASNLLGAPPPAPTPLSGIWDALLKK